MATPYVRGAPLMSMGYGGVVDPDLDRRFHHDSVVVMFVYPTDIRRATLGPKRCLPRLRHAALHRVPGEPVFGLLTSYDVVHRGAQKAGFYAPARF